MTLKIKLVWTVMLLAFFSTAAAAQNFIYTNNDVSGPNTITAFAVDTNGALSQISGSPFSTGGTGLSSLHFAANRIIVVGNFLYASNAGSNNVSAFSIDSNTGYLTPVTGSPFATGSTVTDTVGTSLAAAPSGKFLYAVNGGSADITIFSIASNGALSTVGTRVPAGDVPAGAKVSPDGKYLAVAFSNFDAMSVFSIAQDGTLTPVPGSPFGGSGIGTIQGIDINCASTQLFAAEGSTGPTIVNVFDIGSNGALTAIAGSPFEPGVGTNSNVVVLSPDDKELFVSNQFSQTITAFSVAAGGSLALVAGSPFAVTGSTNPSGMVTTQDGLFLYVADNGSLVSGFSIGSNGALGAVTGSPFAADPNASRLLSLAAYPSKGCNSTFAFSSFTASLSIPGSSSQAKLVGTFTLGSGSDGINPVAEPVTIQIGTYSVTIPPGSFTQVARGSSAGSYTFSQKSGGVTLSVMISPLGNNQFQIGVTLRGANLSGLTNPVTIGLTIGNDAGSTSAMAGSSPNRH